MQFKKQMIFLSKISYQSYKLKLYQKISNSKTNKEKIRFGGISVKNLTGNIRRLQDTSVGKKQLQKGPEKKGVSKKR